MDAVQYKEFYIVVHVQREPDAQKRFQVVSQMRASPDATQSVHTFGTVKEFASAEVAYEFALQQARAWIDQHTATGRIVTEIAQAMAVLDDAFRRCRKEDIRTPDVFAALEAKSVETWPFDQFRFALDSDDPEARWQNLNASLN